MTTKTIRFEGGDVLADLNERTITGLLLPYNEEGATNVGRFQVKAGAVSLPADPSVIGLNVGHDRTGTVGRATRVWEEATGVMATFQIARTTEGDQALASAVRGGTLRKLSAEFGPALVEAGELVAGKAKLWGAALVGRGAFPSAQVLAEEATDDDDDDEAATGDAEVVSSSSNTSEYTDEAGITWRRVEESETATAETADGTTTTTTTVVEETTTDPETEEEEPTMATTPQALATAGAPAARTNERETDPRDEYRQVLAAVATARIQRGHDPAAMQVLAALSDVTVGGTGALPGTGVIQPSWVGHLFQGIPYVREYVTLGKLGTDISLEGKKGFKVFRGTSASPVVGNFDGAWTGNKTEVKSYKGFSTPHTSTRRNFAIAEDIGREFRDLPGGEEVLDAFLRLIAEDYLVQSDDWALEDWISTAGTPVAPVTTKFSDNYPEALGMIIQGILAVKRKKADGRRDTPSFAILNEAGYEDLLYAAGGDENLPAFVSIAISTATEGKVDGNVQIVQGETGIEDTTSAIVGADYAIEFDEVPGGPLHISALYIAKGGIDEAVHGYLQTFVVRSEAVVLVGTADEA